MTSAPLPNRPALRLALLLALCLGGCANLPLPRMAQPLQQLRGDVARQTPAPATPAPAPAAATTPAPTPAPTPVAPPPAAAAATTAPAPAAPEPRFDLIVTGAQARDVFQSMVADTRYSMLMHPEVNGTLSVTLRGVTVREALDSIRDVYGYDYRIDGRRITVYPPSLQTRIFTVHYPTTQRRGRSEVRVSSGSAPHNTSSNGGNGSGTGGGAGSAGQSTPQPDASHITTTTASDYWTETVDALRALLGKGEGRVVIASPQAGTIAVRAMPDELRQVAQFLKASRGAIERQVMLEAKIIEVELREGYQSGIDWSVLRPRVGAGQTSGYPGNPLLGNPNGLPTLPQAAASLLLDAVSLPVTGAGTFGLTLATQGFQAVMGFLETHGDIQVLSSPRVATLNNQKAVLKVGTDEYFVTNVSGGSVASGGSSSGATTTLPSLTLTPFFSGIALDVTPQIDDGQMITLHLRPSVTSVTERTKQVDLGTIGRYQLPLASSSVNETDTVVRVPDGQIVAIGGLMQQEGNRARSGLPGSESNVVTRTLFGNQNNSGRKKELVVLIKPTIIRTADDWQRDTESALAALADGPRRVVQVPAAAPPAPPQAPAPTPAR